jgi:hypothetical protein
MKPQTPSGPVPAYTVRPQLEHGKVADLALTLADGRTWRLLGRSGPATETRRGALPGRAPDPAPISAPVHRAYSGRPGAGLAALLAAWPGPVAVADKRPHPGLFRPRAARAFHVARPRPVAALRTLSRWQMSTAAGPGPPSSTPCTRPGPRLVRPAPGNLAAAGLRLLGPGRTTPSFKSWPPGCFTHRRLFPARRVVRASERLGAPHVREHRSQIARQTSGAMSAAVVQFKPTSCSPSTTWAWTGGLWARAPGRAPPSPGLLVSWTTPTSSLPLRESLHALDRPLHLGHGQRGQLRAAGSPRGVPAPGRDCALQVVANPPAALPGAPGVVVGNSMITRWGRA